MVDDLGARAAQDLGAAILVEGDMAIQGQAEAAVDAGFFAGVARGRLGRELAQGGVALEGLAELFGVLDGLWYGHGAWSSQGQVVVAGERLVFQAVSLARCI
jgi:hypothetical protein